MPGFLDRHLGTITTTGLAGVLGLLGIVLYQQGANTKQLDLVATQNETQRDDITDLKVSAETAKQTLSEINTTLESLRSSISSIDAKIKLNDVDLRAVLVSAGVVKRGDVFFAADYDNSIWVFPNEQLARTLVDRGMTAEPITSLISGFRTVSVASVLNTPPSDDLRSEQSPFRLKGD